MITITRKFEFDAGHRVYRHEGKCAHLHGHRYVVELTITSPDLDSVGRVIDFSKVKEYIGHWIDHNLDHRTMLFHKDPLVDVLTEAGQLIYIMQENPTAENIARMIYDAAESILAHVDVCLHITNVRIWETPNCFADYAK